MENLPNVPVCIAEKNQENETSDDAGEPEEVADVFVYREDVVSLKSNKDARGLVMEVAGEYDSEGSITDDESDAEENERKSAHKTENVGPDNDTANNTSHGDDVDSQSSLPDNKNFPQ